MTRERLALKFNLVKTSLSAALSAALSGALSIAVIGAAATVAAEAAFAAPAPSKERSRLEELFIWKTSEELKLAPAVEVKFTETIHSLNSRRREANAKMDAALASLAQAKTKADAEKALNAHRAALREVQAVQSAEIDKLRPLIGPEKLAQYIVVKSSILEKLKSMLAAPTAPPSAASASGPTSGAPAGSPSATMSPAAPAK